MGCSSSWDLWVDEALLRLQSLNRVRSLRPISLSNIHNSSEPTLSEQQIETFDGPGPWDRSSVEVRITESTYQKWVHDVPSSGEDTCTTSGVHANSVIYPGQFRKLLLFSGNDYMGLHSHPAVRKVAAKVAQEHGMGPRGSALICGYTNYHRLLESCLAGMKNKEDCLLVPTGFAANLAVMVTIGSVSSLLASGKKPSKEEKIALFSDSLNHASIIDGIRLAERQQEVEVFVYRHCDMVHLNTLLSNCTMEKKVVVTDSLFSMDGDFAPLVDLAKLRQKHRFLLVIDDAHGTLVCGKNGAGVAEQFNCESDVDICVGTLSKAVGCQGGFVACSSTCANHLKRALMSAGSDCWASSKKWKQLILSRGRSFIFSTALSVPVVAAAYAAVVVAKKEKWRRKVIWSLVQEFRSQTQLPITSPIISIVVGSEDKTLRASKYLLECGYHVVAIRPPTVPPNSCRLRITLCAAHTREDIKKLISALSGCIKLPDIPMRRFDTHAKL